MQQNAEGTENFKMIHHTPSYDKVQSNSFPYFFAVESGGYSGIESLFILFWLYTNREGGLKHPECLIQNKTKSIIYFCVMTFSQIKAFD